MAFGWRLLRIRGHSMAPALEDGDYAVARGLRAGQRIAIGDVVEAEHPDFGRIVKRIGALRSDAVWLSGQAAASVDPHQIGWTPRARVAARLVWRLSPNGLSRIPPETPQ